MSSSTLAFVLNLIALGVYGYSVFFILFDPQIKGMGKIVPKPLHQYGHFKFLTFQCLLIQTLNAFLHVGAHFSRLLVKPRDLVFTGLAYPVGSLVVYTFWGVWHSLGREFIFPVEVSQYYPDWLNHVTHTVIVPLNLVMIVVLNHKYSRYGVAVNLLYFAFYLGFLNYIKFQTGMYVYKYLEEMNTIQLGVYFCATGLFASLMYKSGQILSNLVHKPASQRLPNKKANKQK